MLVLVLAKGFGASSGSAEELFIAKKLLIFIRGAKDGPALFRDNSSDSSAPFLALSTISSFPAARSGVEAASKVGSDSGEGGNGMRRGGNDGLFRLPSSLRRPKEAPSASASL